MLLAGCAALKPGEMRVVETRVLGMDLSVPIIGASNQNIINIKWGWIETRYAHVYKLNFKSNADQDVSFFSGTGTIHRIFEVSCQEKK